MFSTSNSYVCFVAYRTVFVFFTWNINRWDQLMLFPNWKVMIRRFHSILEVHQNCGLVFWHQKAKKHSCLVIHPQKGKTNFHLKTKTSAFFRALRKPKCFSKETSNMLFSEVVLRSGKLNWNNLEMPLRIAISCILCKQPEKNELWQ